MNRFISKTTVFVALAALLFSCKNNDDTTPIDVDKEFSFTAPDGTELTLQEDLTYISKYRDNLYSLYATTNGQYWNEIISLMMDINDLDKYSPNEDVKAERIDFGMMASSNSKYTTTEFTGKIYLLNYSKAEVSLYFNNLIFNIADGSYTINGKLTLPIILNDAD